MEGATLWTQTASQGSRKGVRQAAGSFRPTPTPRPHSSAGPGVLAELHPNRADPGPILSLQLHCKRGRGCKSLCRRLESKRGNNDI